MSDNHIKEEILDYIRKNNGTSYVGIERIFEENNFHYQGNLEEIVSEQYPNIVLWAGWNEKALEIFREILRSGSILGRCCLCVSLASCLSI